MEIIRSKDGTPIAAWHSGVGAPLLLVHGTTGDHTGWTAVRAALERHFTVWTLDRRGRGSSGDAAVYALERECEDIAAVIAAIGGTVHLLGQSFGGLCALEAALLTPHLGRLILYEPTILSGDPNRRGVSDAHLQALLDAGHAEEALRFFLGDLVQIPPRSLPPCKPSRTGRGGWRRRTQYPASCGRSTAIPLILYDFAPCGPPRCSWWVARVSHTG